MECDCGSPADGKWAGVHSPHCPARLDDLEARAQAIAVKHRVLIPEPVLREMVAYLLEGIRPPLAEVIDERVTENWVTEYLLRPLGSTGDCGIWVDARSISPEDLEPRSRGALFGNEYERGRADATAAIIAQQSAPPWYAKRTRIESIKRAGEAPANETPTTTHPD